jgi:hypothetical protein
MKARSAAQKRKAPHTTELMDFVCSHLSYSPESGALVWKKRPGNDITTRQWNSKFAGMEAGNRRSDGYIVVRFKEKRFLAHRLIWWLYMREQPEIIDHKDRNRSNNRISNLRRATTQLNAVNSGIPSHNKSGAKGVSWIKAKGKWRADIKVNQRPIHLGYFDTIEAASEAYTIAARRHFGAFFCEGAAQ